MKTQPILSVALTSGVVSSVDDTVARFASCIRAIREEFPDIPIGVEPYVSTFEHVHRLKNAGADEIKLNLESPSKDIFSRVCPELDWDNVWVMLDHSVRIFGKGKVSSNIIYGMGETDAEMEQCMEKLCAMGVVPTVRALRSGSMNNAKIVSAIGMQPHITTERMLALAKMQKRIMEKHGLTTKTCHTMCLECTCCDIVPFRDI